ncbi:hypothetical protein [Streptomyces sp. NPDC052225]|uniref:hypothetical protein n=1 Tax=Streptomyces sp. NPDC052225 TaxID=3154949 RepID=UPI00343512A5
MLGAVVLVAAVVALAWWLLQGRGECDDGLAREGDQCIGVNVGSYEFPGLEDIAQRIHKANPTSGDYVTVVYMEPMSGGSQDRGEGATREAVTGAYLAQKFVNRDPKSQPKIRILLANTGRGDAYAEQVARQLVEHREEYRLVAVAGIGQSNKHTEKAVRVLSAADIPTVGATVAADSFTKGPRNFFRVAFSARAQARAAVGHLVREQRADPGYRVRIVRDMREGDAYNSALYSGFKEAAGRAGLKVAPGYVPFWSEGGSTEDSEGNALSTVAQKLCRDQERPDAVFFAGRGREIRGLILQAGTEMRPCPITIVSGSSTVGVYFDTKDDRALQRSWQATGMQVKYTAYTHPEVPGKLYGKHSLYPEFADEYRHIDTGGRLADGQAMLGRDAVYVAAMAARGAWTAYGSDGVTAAHVRSQLGQINRGDALKGVGGPIAFDEATGEPVERPMALVQLGKPDDAQRYRFRGLLKE